MTSGRCENTGWRMPAALGLFCGLLLVPSAVWLWLDHRVWDWDPAEYGYLAIDLWRVLWTEPRLWPWWFFHGVGPKAPTLIWMAQFLLPLRHVVGSAQAVFSVINLSFQWASLVLLWRCVHRVTGRGWLACALCLWLAGMPLFAGMSRDFLTEPLQLFAVLFIWHMAVSGADWPASKMAAALLWGGAWVLGAKASTPVYCVVPGLYSLYLLVRSIRGKRWGFSGWTVLGMATGAVHLGVIAGWYVLNRAAAMQKVVDASVGEAAYHFGYQDTVLNKMAYWIRALGRSLSLNAVAPLLVAGALVLVAGWVWHIRQPGGGAIRGRGGRFILLAALQGIVVLVVLSLNVSTPIRYVYALVPTVLLAAAPLLGAGRGRWRTVFLPAVFGIWYAASHLLLLGWIPADEVRRARHWAGPERDPAKLEQIRHLVRRLNIPEYSGVYHLCGADFSWLNGSTLNYYAALDSLDTGCRTQFGRLGSFVEEADPAWARVHGQLGSYIAASDAWMEKRTDRYGEISREILRRIRRDPRFQIEPHPELPDIALYRNRTFGGKESGDQP